jgi:hypothetical protein
MKGFAHELLLVAKKIEDRIADDGSILGWRGFHVDLDRLTDLVEALQLGARGIFPEDEENRTP